MSAAMASLKGPKHGGANIKVTQMFADMKEKISDWTDEDEVHQYLEDLLDKKAFDQKGLIYGMVMRFILYPIRVRRFSSNS